MWRDHHGVDINMLAKHPSAVYLFDVEAHMKYIHNGTEVLSVQECQFR